MSLSERYRHQWPTDEDLAASASLRRNSYTKAIFYDNEENV
jgi:hypothetical protein